MTDQEFFDFLQWNEKLPDPKVSAITNFNFSEKHLFKSWTHSRFKPTDSIFTFNEEYVTIHTDNKDYKYTINYDSLRIFTNYEIVGLRRSKGIIKELNEDRMLIIWSDSDNVHEWTPTKIKPKSFK